MGRVQIGGEPDRTLGVVRRGHEFAQSVVKYLFKLVACVARVVETGGLRFYAFELPFFQAHGLTFITTHLAHWAHSSNPT